jgi:hypothetical protein
MTLRTKLRDTRKHLEHSPDQIAATLFFPRHRLDDEPADHMAVIDQFHAFLLV